jgi:hypothetical protein
MLVSSLRTEQLLVLGGAVVVKITSTRLIVATVGMEMGKIGLEMTTKPLPVGTN